MKLLCVRWNSTALIPAIFLLVHVSLIPLRCASQTTIPPVNATTEDTTPPDALFSDCPPDNITNNPIIDYQEPTAVDQSDDGASLNVLCNYPPRSQLPENEVTTIICTATDAAGNVALNDCSFNVTVDTIPPNALFSDCPPDNITNNPIIDYQQPTAVDKTDGGTSLNVSCNYPPRSQLPENKETIVVCTAIDAAGNVALNDCSFTVTVDTTPPDALFSDCPPDNITNNPIIDYQQPTAVDQSDSGTSLDVLCNYPPRSQLPENKETIVVCTATDAAGNVALNDCSFTITVDTTPPDALFTNCPPDNITNNPIIDYQEPTAVDQSDGGSILNVLCNYPPRSQLPENEVTTVICTAADAAGNVAENNCNFTVTVDVDPPIFNQATCPSSTSHYADWNTNSTLVTWDDPTATDNIDPNPQVTCRPTSDTMFVIGEKEVTCTARDAAGNYADAPCLFTVTVTELRPPTIDNITDVTNETMLISWTLPDVVETFTIEYTGTFRDTVTMNQTVPGSTCSMTSYKLTGLVPGETYSLRVIAVSGLARAKSDESKQTTDLNQPTITAVTSVTMMSMFVEWSNPPNSVVESYMISYTGTVEDLTPQNETIGDVTSATLDDLLAGETYTVKVTANSGSQESGRTSAESQEWLETTVPQNVSLDEVDSTVDSITARWLPPTRPSVIEYYSITCDSGQAEPPKINYTSGVNTASCINLTTAGREYRMTVESHSGNKESSTSITIFALPNGVSLEEGTPSTTAVQALWSNPVGDVDSFKISCSYGTPDPSEIPVTNPAQGIYSASCVSLPRPGDTYIMTVYVESNGKQDNSSHINLIALPQAVDNLQTSAITTTSISLSWDTSSCLNCVFESFNVFRTELDGFETIAYESGTSTYQKMFDSLIPGHKYTFSVIAISGTKESSVKEVTQRTVPSSITIDTQSSTKTSIELTWIAPVGDKDGYELTIEPQEGTITERQPLDLTANFTGLSPGWKYTIFVVTLSGNSSSETVTINVSTEEDNPGPVSNLTISDPQLHSVTISFIAPDEPKGIVTGYVITYSGTRKTKMSPEKTISIAPKEITKTIEGLLPGYTYSFTVQARNGAGLGEESVITETTLIKSPDSSNPVKPTTSNPNTLTTTTITATFQAIYFSHDNGELINYTVIIAQKGADANSITSSPMTWFKAQDKDPIPPYQAFPQKAYPFPPDPSRRKKLQTTPQQIDVVIGNDENCESNSGYCNGPLRDDTSYVYLFRAWNDAGYADTVFSDPVTTVNDNSLELGLGLGLGLPIIIVAAAGLLVLVIGKRKWKPRKLPENGNSNQAYEHDLLPVRKQGNTRPVHLTDFPEHDRTMNADSQYLFSQEYEDLRPIGRDQPVEAALSDTNRSKNRFTNILPYDHTRVKLKPVDDEEGSDYINANYMPGYNSPREFIACQGPLPGTENDLWRMVWEQRISTIVMVTQLVEKGRVKCHKYWPASDKPVYFGDVYVGLHSEVKLKHWILREFELHKGEKTRKVYHFNFTTWPDHGVPENPDGILQFVRKVRSHIANNDHPALVHCSAGVGRTGTFICLDRLIQHMKEHDNVDIFGIVSEMRMHRNYMVQTEDQYIFIHECVMHLLQGQQTKQTNGDALYENVTL